VRAKQPFIKSKTGFLLFSWFLFFLTIPVYSFYNNRNNPDIGFSVFTTPHFKFVYQEGLDSLALRAASVAEAALPAICEDLRVNAGNTLPEITVILTDIDDISNGFSSPLGHTIELFAHPMLQKTTGSLGWIDRVMVHELTHQLTYCALRRGFGIYSEGFFTAFLPTWFLEGIAQFEAEEWDKNREFLLRSCYNKFLFLDRDHLYGFITGDYVSTRLLYEQGHSLYRFLTSKSGRDIGGKILANMGLFNPVFSSALKKTTGASEAQVMMAWRLALEEDYPLAGTGTRVNQYAGETNHAVSSIMEQVFYLRRREQGFYFTGMERIDVYEQNLYWYSPNSGLIKIDGPGIGLFFDMQDNTLFYSKMVRHTSGTLVNLLFKAGQKGRVQSLNNVRGEEPCVLPGGRIAFVRFASGLSTLYSCDTLGNDVAQFELPDSIAQVFKPQYARDRIYFSIIEFSGERKIASLTVDGGDYRIEIEKHGTDVRLPWVAENGVMAYLSNKHGPFNVVVRDTAGNEKWVSADPYGVFAPVLTKHADSVIVTGLRTEEADFSLSCFSLSTDETRDPAGWNMDLSWKNISAIDHTRFEAEIEDMPEATGSAYHAGAHLRPLLAYPYFKDFSNESMTKPGVRVLMADPLEKHSFAVEGFYCRSNNQAGGEVDYWNTTQKATLHFSLARNFITTEERYNDRLFLRTIEGQDAGAIHWSLPIDMNAPAPLSQHVSAGFSVQERGFTYQWFDPANQTIYSKFTAARDRSLPFSLGYALSWVRNYTGLPLHPLDAYAFSTSLSVADTLWGSDVIYRLAAATLQTSTEIGVTYHTVYTQWASAALVGRTNTRLSVPAEHLPRGKTFDRWPVAMQYGAFTAEYRIPLVRDLGFSLFGFYFDMLSVAGFWDNLFIAMDNPFWWTAGIQARQRIYFLGKETVLAGFGLAYDPDAAGHFSFFMNAGTGF